MSEPFVKPELMGLYDTCKVIAADFNRGICPELRPYVRAYAEVLLAEPTVMIDIIGYGHKAKGVDHLNSRIARFMYDFTARKYLYVAGCINSIGIPYRLRKGRDIIDSTDKMLPWVNKNADKILAFVEKYCKKGA